MESTINQTMLLHSAKGFYENGIKLAKTLNTNLGVKAFEIAPVAAVNISFAAELLLKLLYHLVNNKVIIGHRLDKLFYSLDHNLRKQIEDRYNKNKVEFKNDIYPIKLSFNTVNKNPYDQINEFDIGNLKLKNLLKIHSDGFVKWRYAFDVEEKYYSYEFNFNLMNEFIKALLSIIDRKINKDLN